MILIRRILLGVSALFVFGLWRPLYAQVDISPPVGAWTHSATATAFPESAEGYLRTRIVEYEESNNSVGYVYRSGNDNLTLTIYLYPALADVACEEEFAGVKAALNNYRGLALIKEDRTSAPDGKGGLSAYVARYKIPAGAMRNGLPEMISDAYLYCSPDKKWLVKYRASWTGTEASFPDTGRLMRAINWPIVLREPPNPS